MVDVHNQAISNAKITVGTSPAVQLPDIGSEEVWITAHPTNSGLVYVGGSDVTSSGGGTVFTVLQAGTGAVLQLNNPSDLYVIGSAASQVVLVGVLK